MTRRMLAVGWIAIGLCAGLYGDAGDPHIAIVGEDAADLGSIFEGFRLRPDIVPTIGGIPDDADAVLVLADSYPVPRALTARDIERLEALARAGARVYVEFAQPGQGGECFGAAFGQEAKRAIHERLVVLRPLGALKPEDLLEEHDTAYMPFDRMPEGAEVMLEYDLALGTYDRVAWPEPGVYTVTVDLGAEREVASASQRYGAGQPNYYPESVELWLSSDGEEFRKVARRAQAQMPETVRFSLDGQRARYVRLVARKFRRSPVTDFLFMGEIEVRDKGGKNLALSAPYKLQSSHEQSPAYRDRGGLLTDGIVEGLYEDHLSVGWGTPSRPEQVRFPAVVRAAWGRGEVILSGPRLSDFRRRNFRLTKRWEELWRQVVLSLMPPAERDRIAARHVPLEAHTEPRVWAAPGTPVKLVITTALGAEVTASSKQMGGMRLRRVEDGRFEAAFVAESGSHEFAISARTAAGSASMTVPFDCRPRREKYRQALDLNVKWFTDSGVLPRPDGSGGIYSQVCMAWLESRPADHDPLGSPFRVDCNAMSAEAFYLHGLVTGDERYKRIACKIADTVIAHQYTEKGRASLGGFPWLYENNEIIFFWDDNCRISNALLWLYHWTGEERYLRSALLCAELFRQVARDDTCVHRHAISRGDLDKIGREAYRRYQQGGDADYRLMHWWTLAAVTGDETYRKLGEECARLWGGRSGMRGASHAYYYSQSAKLRERMTALAEGFLKNPSVRKYGMTTVGGGGYQLAFRGDCGIATRDGEPLTDQIYTTPWAFLHAVRAWKATGEETCRRMCETVGDYLVRIQFRHPDKRLEGCWMRGFDAENWEYYGAPYDPAYGPYSAYTGWMNAIASQAFARYLLNEEPFAPSGEYPGARAILAAVRAQNPRLISDGENVALNCSYRLSDPSSGVHRDDGKKLTDGVIEGPYQDHLSVGWSIPKEGEARSITMDLDLQRLRRLKLITQQYGAGQGGYNPDEVRALASEDGAEFREIGRQRFDTRGTGLLWLMLEEPVTARCLRFELKKRRRSWNTDFLFVGETKAYEGR